MNPHMRLDPLGLLGWASPLVVIAAVTITIGNITAVRQDNIKRMLAYSSIANMGYMLMGFLAANPNGYSAAMFYAIAYVLTSLASFGMIMLLSREGFEADQLDDFKGLNQRSPWWAFMMLLVMFSLTGVPPTLGFYAKFAVLEAAVNQGFVWLAVIAVLTSVVGAFYYLRIVKLMYFDEPVDLLCAAEGIPLSRRRASHREEAGMLGPTAGSRCAPGLGSGRLY